MQRVLVAVITFSLLMAAGLWCLTRSQPAFDDLNQELQYLVSQVVANDPAVKSCVLAVKKGDGSFSWSGAAGIASQDTQAPMRRDTPLYLASITKIYTATAIMRLYEEGRLQLDDPMSQYLPPELIQGIHVYQGRDYSPVITIRELLSHTSGIADYYTGKEKGGKSLFEVFLEDPHRTWTVNETIARARDDLEPLFPPGTEASYSDTNFQLLGKIIETVSGDALHVVFEDMFFGPLGLRHTWLVGRSEPRCMPAAAAADIFRADRNITRVRSNGSYWADGGLVSPAEDCIIFLEALKEGRLVRGDTLEMMHSWHKLTFPLHYGYGTMYFALPRCINGLLKMPPLWGHSGSSGSFLYYCEDLDLYLAGSINQTERPSVPFKLMRRVIKALQAGEKDSSRQKQASDLRRGPSGGRNLPR